MLNKILTIIFFGIILFDIFMVTPFGAAWTMKNLDEDKPCYGIIIAFLSAIPLMFIGGFLGFIKQSRKTLFFCLRRARPVRAENSLYHRASLFVN